MRELIRFILLLGLVLLIPVLPFFLFEEMIETWFGNWLASPPQPTITALVVIGLLASDIFLPVPSSLVSTVAGAQLGVLYGTLACWLGLNLSVVIGFALARRWGRQFALRFTTRTHLEQLGQLNTRYGPSVLVALRAVPVLAEASVLMVGIHGLSWARFLPPALLSNLGIALAYVKFGEVADNHGWLPMALAISLALPILLAGIVHWWIGRRSTAPG